MVLALMVLMHYDALNSRKSCPLQHKFFRLLTYIRYMTMLIIFIHGRSELTAIIIGLRDLIGISPGSDYNFRFMCPKSNRTKVFSFVCTHIKYNECLN